MGVYLNPGSQNFRRSINSEIYVDKTKLISFTNSCLNTQQGYICVSRPRRFGKTMAADMLSAYYTSGEDTRDLFRGMAVFEEDSFAKNLNRFNVIKVDMQTFMTKTKSVEDMLARLTRFVMIDIRREYPEILFRDAEDLSESLSDVFQETGKQFVLIIDEWDCVIRRYHALKAQMEYLDFLRNLMKDQPFIALAFMTGILPIKKYGEHSTLNMFFAYSMIDSASISDCFGFTENEVIGLCKRYSMDFREAQEWYNGYHMVVNPEGERKDYSIYNPKSIVESMHRHKFDTYWNQTESYDALKVYIKLNIDGLKDAIIEMLSGNPVEIDTGVFQNDMSEFHSRDEVLTLLVHLGYLTYDQEEHKVSIPNKEVASEFMRSIRELDSWSEIANSVQESRKLLQSLWDMDSDAVAAGIEKAHQEISHLEYNDENSLSCVITLAFYNAREYYTVVREFPTGKGFADICFIPKKHHLDKPAVVVELKYNHSVTAAIAQIKKQEYPAALKDYQGNLLLCGISYGKKKEHRCSIEKFVK
ncbi:MAG: ATP-binding protein [Lachnospiraceae bacterium]|nr:ATP-binding protein [Lachnospiraceae bacterium]